MLIEHLYTMHIATITSSVDNYLYQRELERRECIKYQEALSLGNAVRAIVAAAELAGSIHCLDLIGNKKRFRDSIVKGIFWYRANRSGQILTIN